MSIDEYLGRINNITKYYYESCENYEKRFYVCCFIRIIASAVIPVISLASKIDWSTVCVSLLACLITISEAYVNVTRAYEKWTKYRDICNLLWIECLVYNKNTQNCRGDSPKLQREIPQ